MYFDCISRYRGVFEHKPKTLPAPCSEIPFHRFFTFNTELTAKKKGTK